MIVNKELIQGNNKNYLADHRRNYEFIAGSISNLDDLIKKLTDFQIAIPSWALGTGGTRFGRFPGGGEPRNLEEKIEDIGLLHALNRSSGAISLHIPWDIPENALDIKTLAEQNGLKFDAMNSNSLQEVYSALPDDWKIFVEYKAFEPNFYSTTVGDWGQSLLYTSKLGKKAYTLVDLGHHLANANIEQIVSLLLMEGKLGGFHFNDSKYGDDDLTVGSIKPYQLFLIFNELVEGMNAQKMNHATDLAWMIDASHNVKDPLEDLLQSVEAIMISYAQALIIDREKLEVAQNNNDVVLAQEILQEAFRTDVRALVAEARLRAGGAINPLAFYRNEKVREQLIKERGLKSLATGL